MTYSRITRDFVNEAFVETNLFKNTKILTFFALIVRLHHVAALEEESEINTRSKRFWLCEIDIDYSSKSKSKKES